jgi:membrane fusion protein, heavy metal efflux system
MRYHALPALLLATALGGCSGGEAVGSPASAAPAPADTALVGAEAVAIADFGIHTAALAAWQDEWTVPGRLTLDPSATQTLGAVAEGRVTRVLVLPGDRVRAGQVLLTLHSHEMMDARGALSSAQAALSGADAELRRATAAAERAERLYAARAMSLADLERARSELVGTAAVRAQAVAELERARGLVGHLSGTGPVPRGVDPHEVLVRSPIDGTVVARRVQPGEVALVGQPLVTVSRTSSLGLVLNLPEPAFGAARPGAEIRFAAPGYPGREFVGVVKHVAPAVDTITRTLEVLATVDDPHGLLRPEMFVTAHLSGGAGGEVLRVPAEAVQAFGGDTVVIVVRQRGEGLHLEAVPVRTGRRTADWAELRGGIAPGTRIIARRAAIARAEILRQQEQAEAAP